jgi:hypothetical protein
MTGARSFQLPRYGSSLEPHAASAAFSAAELALLLSLFLAVFEGAARKWIFPGNAAVGYALYFSKDIAFAAALFLAKPGQASALTISLRNWITVGVGLTFLGAFVAAMVDLNWVGAVLTLRATIILPVCALLAATRFSHIPATRTIWMVVLCGVLNFGLGAVQFTLPSDHILNTYSDATLEVVRLEGGVRAAGTFSYISGMTVMSTFGVWAGLCLMSVTNSFTFAAGAFAAIAGVGCGLVSVSRAPVVIAALILGLWLVFSGVVRTRLVQIAVASCAIFGLVIFTASPAIVSEYTSVILLRHEEAQENESMKGRTLAPLMQTFEVVGVAPLGVGLGTEQVAGVWAETGTSSFSRFEAPWPRLVLEMGVLGVLGFAITCAGVLLSLWKAARNARFMEYRGIAIATLFTAGSFFATNVLFNHVASGMLWPIVGLVLAAGEAEKREESEERPNVQKSGDVQYAD